jgi:lipopolysaccharide export system permease protein
MQYYVGFLPHIVAMIFPLFVFISVIFFTSKMALQSEVIAILASGTTYNRWLRPYFIGGVLFATGLWLATRHSIPKANEVRGNFQAKYIDRNGPQGGSYNQAFYIRADTNTYVGVKYYDTLTKTAGAFFLDRIKDGKVIYNLRAESMHWDTAKKRWQLQNAVERTLDSMKESIQQRPQMHINLTLKPTDLRKDDYLKDKLSTPELVNYIKLEELRGKEGLNTLKVEQYRRTATPATVLLLALIGAIVAGRKVRGGSGLHLATGIGIAAVFILSDRFSTVFSIKGNLPPLIAAWIPNVVFSLVAWYLYRKAPK